MHRLFNEYTEVEQDIRAKAPPVVYKYRDWNNPFHQTILTSREAWFSHPFDLNDPLDVRPETVFIKDELYSEAFFKKMLGNLPDHFKGTSAEEQLSAAREQWELTKKDPSIIIQNHLNYDAERAHFDPFGVFSTALDGLITVLWEEYANQLRGFCVGLDTVELCRDIQSSYGFVSYGNEPVVHSFLEPDEDQQLNELYYKKTKWAQEQEFRFITVGIGKHAQRKQYFKPHVLKEVILGKDISANHQDDIVKVVQSTYGKSVSIFKIKGEADGTLYKASFKP